MATKTEIANIALGLIGANLVTNVDADDSEEAKQIRIQYDAALNATLEVQEWSFAIKRFEPALVGSAPLYGWTNAFQPPPDIIRVLSCDRQVSGGPMTGKYDPGQIDWDFEGGLILTDEDVVYARGISNLVREGDFSPTFVQAFAARLAMMVALPLTQSQQIFQNCGGLFNGLIREAKTRDGMQGRSKRIRNRAFIRVR
jgi:hypothetical protein